VSNGVTPKSVEALGRRHLMLFGGRASRELAQEVAQHLGIECGSVDIRDFANGETYARFGESVRGTDAFVIQTHAFPVNERIMEQLVMIDALKRASAKRISAVMPYYGYSRQDKKGRSREPITAKLVADMFKVAGADRLITVDLHSGQVQGFFDGPVDHLTARPLLADHIRAHHERDLVVVAPVTVGNGAQTAAGSTITKDVPPDALAIERSDQRTIVGWAARRRRRKQQQ